MRLLRVWWSRIGGLFEGSRMDGDLSAELEAHLQLHIDDGMLSGLSFDEASRQAILKLGGVEATKELYRERRGIPFVDGVVRDLQHAARTLRKLPGFSAVAIVSLALGIGANTAMFSLIHAVMLRPLPVPQEELLIRIGQKNTGGEVSLTEYEFLKRAGTTHFTVAGYQGATNRRLVHGGEGTRIGAMPITPGFFGTLGGSSLSLAVGREFSAVETRPGASPTVILSDSFWRRSFGSDPVVLGKAIQMDGVSYTIVGVTAPTFWFHQTADVFFPLVATGETRDAAADTELIARLKPDSGLGQAQAELSLLSEHFRLSHPEFDAGDGGKYRGMSATLYRTWLVGDTGRKLLLLLGAVALLLLIACLNLASLLLARTASRQGEIAVRLALGSSRGRLFQQFTIENAMVGAASAVAGLVTADWMLRGFLAVVPFRLPVSAEIRLDAPVLLFAAALATGTILLVSLAPFLMAGRLPVYETLKQSGRNARHRSGARYLLLMGEIAISATLLVGATLLARSLYDLNRQPLGFAPENLLTFWAPPPDEVADNGPRLRRLERLMLKQIRAIPGVQSVAAVNVIPLEGKNNFPAQREGHPEQSVGGMEIRLITPDYFQTMRIPVRNGRGFNDRDASESPAVVLINETLARRWWPEGRPIGDRIVVGQFRGRMMMQEATREVVGVVGDTKTVLLSENTRPTLFIPVAQALWSTGGMSWVVRGSISTGLAQRIQNSVKRIAPEQSIERLRPMNDIVAEGKLGTRFDATLYGAFAVLALLVSTIGIYGMLSWSAAQRTREMGLRIALGSTRGKVIWLILKSGFPPVAGGVIIGLGGAFALTRSMAKMLFGVGPTDAPSILAVSVLLLAVGCGAGYLPARRAARMDPLVALREE
jgi:predicted permease